VRFLPASRPANQSSDDAHYLPEASPPTPAVRAKRALRTAPVVLVRGVRVPAYTDTGPSIVTYHRLDMLPAIPYRTPHQGLLNRMGSAGASAPGRTSSVRRPAHRRARQPSDRHPADPADGGPRRDHRSYAVRMSDSPVSPQETRAAAAANAELGPGYAELGPGYCDAVVASFQG